MRVGVKIGGSDGLILHNRARWAKFDCTSVIAATIGTIVPA